MNTFCSPKTIIEKHRNEIIPQTEILIILYMIAFSIFNNSEQVKKYTNTIGIILIGFMALYCILNSKNILSPITVLFTLFTLFSFCSIIWAPVKDEALRISKTFAKLLVMSVLIYNFLASQERKEVVLRGFVMAGIVISLCYILHYGPAGFISALKTGARLDAGMFSLGDVVDILVLASLSAMWFAFFRKRWWDLLFVPFMLLAAIATGTRSFFFGFFVGLLCLMFLFAKGKWRILSILIVIAMCFLGLQILKLPYFGALYSRLSSFAKVFSDSSATDGSASSRIQMIKWGFEQFLKTPILGLGAFSGQTVMSSHGSGIVVFHNAFIDILSCYGIVGFSLYFSMFAFPFFVLIKPALQREEDAVIGIVLITTILAMFMFGSECYEKVSYMVIVYGFLAAESVRRRQKTENGNT